MTTKNISAILHVEHKRQDSKVCSADGRSGEGRKIDDTAEKIEVWISDPGKFPGLSFCSGDEPKYGQLTGGRTTDPFKLFIEMI